MQSKTNSKTVIISEAEMVTSAAIDMLTNEQRIALRERLIAAGVKLLPRNLYYNYEEQRWI